MQEAADETRSAESAPLPSLPSEGGVLPLFGTVIYPQTVTPLAISQQSAVRLVDDVLENDGLLTLVALRAEHMRPAVIGTEQCYLGGTVAVIHRLLRLPDNTLRIAAEGIERVRITQIDASGPYLRARFEPWPDRPVDLDEEQSLLAQVIEQVHALSRFLPVLTDDLQLALANEESPQRLSYLLAMSIAAYTSVAERQALLERDTVSARLTKLIDLITSELERVQARQPDAVAMPSLGSATLERRPELRDLPLIQEALEAGRLEGARSLLTTLLRDRFGDDQALIAIEARLHVIQEREVLERLGLLAARAVRLDDIANAL